MAGISSHSFKTYQRGQRKLVNEGAFNGGMQYVDSPLAPGFSRMLVNFIQKDMGNSIRPRGGWRKFANDLTIGTNGLYIHHSGLSYVKDLETNKLLLRRYILLLSQSGDSPYGTMDGSSKIIVEEVHSDTEGSNIDGTLMLSTIKPNAEGFAHVNAQLSHKTYFNQQVHDMPLANPAPVGLFGSVNGNTYLPGRNGILYRLEIYRNADGSYNHDAVKVTYKNVTPTQAVNLGYNMLLSEPYEFENKSTGFLNLQGILPYEPNSSTLKMQAELGDLVTFKLIYDYNSGASYKVRWELRDIARETVDVLQEQASSPTYTGGAEISINVVPTYKQFSLSATVFEESDLVNPIQVMFLPAYNLVDKGKSSKVLQQNYTITECTGMTVFKDQLVYWGIEGAEMAICLSAVNDPTYVPFPNNHISFDTKVLHAMPHLDSLIVATETSIYQVDMTPDGYTKKSIQSNLKLRADDTIAMFSIRNMVHFKSGNGYFMIVPNTKVGKGELQIAPISTPIDRFLQNFKSSCWELITSVYDVTDLLDMPETQVEFRLADYRSYPYGNAIHSIYKLEITNLPDGSRFLDLRLVYDTVFRAWTVEVMEATRVPMHPFHILATGSYQFLCISSSATSVQTAQWLRVSDTNIVDDFTLDLGYARLFKNHQMFDTGKRDLDGTKKKRMRHVILELNNLSRDNLLFNFRNRLDDQIREDFYSYDIVQDVDPQSPTYGQIYVERSLIEPTQVFGETKMSNWSLGNSQFPEQTVMKVHIETSGKGYYPRIQFLTVSDALYEINTVSWAYRDMYAR